MKNVVLSIVAVMFANVMFAGTPTNNNTTAKKTAKKSNVVYMWKGESHSGLWYHTDAKCAACKKDVIGEGKLYVTTAKGAKTEHLHECPVCVSDVLTAMNTNK